MSEFSGKSTVQEIKEHFDGDVERFTHLETGQTATVDAPLAMELITRAAASLCPDASRILDIGCGAGNNTLKLLQMLNPLDCDLVDLSLPMLEKARERIEKVNSGKVQIFQSDFRDAELGEGRYQIILAAAVLHHLRDDGDWENAFKKIFNLTAEGGCVWITDLIAHENAAVQNLMWKRYGDYLESTGGTEYRDKVFSIIEIEDSPRPVTYQLQLLEKVGFSQVEILHKNSCFASFGAVK